MYSNCATPPGLYIYTNYKTVNNIQFLENMNKIKKKTLELCNALSFFRINGNYLWNYKKITKFARAEYVVCIYLFINK